MNSKKDLVADELPTWCRSQDTQNEGRTWGEKPGASAVTATENMEDEMMAETRGAAATPQEPQGTGCQRFGHLGEGGGLVVWK